MIIEQVDVNKIKVIVDSDEQRKYGISYESMTYCDCNTRKLCENIVERARSEVGFCLDDSKLLVEAKQGLNGTVTLFLSKIPILADDGEELYCQTLKFGSVNALLDSDLAFKRFGNTLKCRYVYAFQGAYYIYFEVFTTKKNAQDILRALIEFAERSGLSYAALEEHGQRLYSYE